MMGKFTPAPQPFAGGLKSTVPTGGNVKTGHVVRSSSFATATFK